MCTKNQENETHYDETSTPESVPPEYTEGLEVKSILESILESTTEYTYLPESIPPEYTGRTEVGSILESALDSIPECTTDSEERPDILHNTPATQTNCQNMEESWHLEQN